MAITPAGKGGKGLVKGARRVRTRHRQLMYRVLASEAPEKICKEMNISREALDILIASPLFKSELAKLSSKLRDRFLQSGNLTAEEGLRQLNPLALRTLTAIMNKEKLPLTIRRAVAKDIIDYNLKLDEIKKKGGLSENAAFFIKAHANAQKREARRLKELKELKAAEASSPGPAEIQPGPAETEQEDELDVAR